LPVHNVVNVRPQAGGAGTIVNNLAALGISTIHPVGFAGQDGEGYELWHALEQQPGVGMGYFVRTTQRRTFTYCKPLVMASGVAPVELNRLDLKNWTPTPALLQGLLIDRLQRAVEGAAGVIVMDQVPIPESGVVTQKVLQALGAMAQARPDLLILADSRRGLRGFPPVRFKMNAAELAALRGVDSLGPAEIESAAAALAGANGKSVFVTLAERGILGVTPAGRTELVPALPVHGEVDIVGAGDAVSANLVAALAAGADLREALELANAAASVVIHKLGTTGTASVVELGERLLPASS